MDEQQQIPPKIGDDPRHPQSINFIGIYVKSSTFIVNYDIKVRIQAMNFLF
jgi:hypothetical protein